MSSSRIHDRAILDALEDLTPESLQLRVWRVTRKGRDPLRGTAAHGRWTSIGEFEVLYTSVEKNGALAEVGFRLSLEPIWPSLIRHQLHTIEVKTERTLQLANLDDLAKLGVDTAKYETFDYETTQAIAAAAHFLEFDGLLVPSARFGCSNLVLFMDRISTNDLSVTNTELIDWEEWKRFKNK
ncbi:MAG: RES family NAD+ phosphorylase [Xanthobacteraceae bacterium]|nr:RES family NAD+ phosphorylase [Xanthobacteraceae bacterium]